MSDVKLLPEVYLVYALKGSLQFSLPLDSLGLLVVVPHLCLRRPVARGLHLVKLSLLHTEGESKVDGLEDLVLAAPEDVVRLQVCVNNPILVEAGQRGQEVPGKLDHKPWGEAMPVILEYYLTGRQGTET